MRFSKKLIAFILLNILFFHFMMLLLIPPSGFSMRVTEFKNGSYTSVILGHSWARDGLNPYALAENENDHVYNLGQGRIEVHHFLPLLKELKKTSPVKRVYVDLCPLYWEESEILERQEEGLPYIYDCLSGFNRISYFFQFALRQDFAHLIADYEITETSPQKFIENLKLNLDPHFETNIPQYLDTLAGDKEGYYMGNGYNFITEQLPENAALDYYTHYTSDDFMQEAASYFCDLASYCRKQDIELIAVMSALPSDRLLHENWDVPHDYYSTLCESLNIPFYDMNYVKWDFLPRTADDYSDADGHMRGELAARQSELLRQILLSDQPGSFFAGNYGEVLAGIPSIQKN